MESSQGQLIELCNQCPEVREALREIREFKLQTIKTMPREFLMDLEEEVGFVFSAKGLTQRRNEVLYFVQSHPEVMNNDIEELMVNIAYYLNLDQEEEKVTKGKRSKDQRKRVHSRVKEIKKAPSKAPASQHSSKAPSDEYTIDSE